MPFTPKTARERTIVGAFDFFPARELKPTSKNERTVPIIAAKVACQKEIPKPRKNEPYESANKETLAPHHGQNKDEAFPERSLSAITFVPFSSKFNLLPFSLDFLRLIYFPSLAKEYEVNSPIKAKPTFSYARFAAAFSANTPRPT